MNEHVRFHYDDLDSLRAELGRIGAEIPLSDDLSALAEKAAGCANRIVFQPMEGCDGDDGSPGELTVRRYKKYAAGGAGMIWFEATAVVPEARANPRQLWLHSGNADDFRAIVDMMRETCARENGFAPKIILQATHSGRYSKPEGVPAPIIAYNNPILEGDMPIDASRIVSDDELDRAADAYHETARLAELVGFDGIDIKCCHRYLASELLSAYGREGRYGGPYENRTRFIKRAYDAARSAVSAGFALTSRMNIYDGYPYPFGFGTAPVEGSSAPELSEAKRLVSELRGMGMSMLNVTMGNPYNNPHVNRPYDNGGYVPPEHPLAGVARMLGLTAEVAKANAGLPVVCSGFSYLRRLSPYAAAGVVKSGGAELVGFGREGFAYPDFPRDIIKNGEFDRKKVCVCCSKCTELMRAGSVTGCVVRDRHYTELYKSVIAK